MQTCCRVLVWAGRFTERRSAARRATQLAVAQSARVRVFQSSASSTKPKQSTRAAQKQSAATPHSQIPSAMKAKSNAGSADEAAPSRSHEQPRGKKRKKPQDPYLHAMMSAIRSKNAEAAWKSYGDAKEHSTVQPGLLKAMANLFLGAPPDTLWMDDWALHILPLPGHEPDADAPQADMHVQRAEHMLHKIQEGEHALDDQYFALKARLCAVKTEPEGALQAAEACAATGTVRLRLYIPALVAFAAKGDAVGAMRTFDCVCSHGDNLNDLSETDYHYLVHVFCKKGTYQDLSKVLKHMSTRLGSLSEPVLQTLRTGFQEGLQIATGGVKSWDVSSVHVDPKGDGFVEAVQEHLHEISLETAEWDQFAQSVRQLADSRERKSGAFTKFAKAIKKSDHSIFLDAANIAFFNTMKFMTNKEKQCDERFQWPQVIKVYNLVRDTFPDSRVMVIAHNYRCRDQFVRTTESQEFLDQLQEEGNLWVTPNGSNDDWYWLYGAISKGRDGMLISNDDMRDHIFELLRPRYFSKWRQHHRCKYNVSTEELSVEASLELPPKFSTCIQHLPQSQAWMFPGEDGVWLCARQSE